MQILDSGIAGTTVVGHPDVGLSALGTSHLRHQYCGTCCLNLSLALWAPGPYHGAPKGLDMSDVSKCGHRGN